MGKFTCIAIYREKVHLKISNRYERVCATPYQNADGRLLSGLLGGISSEWRNDAVTHRCENVAIKMFLTVSYSMCLYADTKCHNLL